MKTNDSGAADVLRDAAVAAEMRRLTRRSFATGAMAALAGAAGVGWLATRPPDDGIPWPLRRVHQLNERVGQAVFGTQGLAPEFPLSRATKPRVNGRIGLGAPPDVENWAVRITGQANRLIPLAALKELPSHEMTTEFKCVEGWSRIVNWRGVRLADFLAKFGVPTEYVGLSTPLEAMSDEAEDHYFVGLDRHSALHPQTMLCFEMNGKPLTSEHGAPLRLVSAVKYGYKCIKRIGAIELTSRRPPDYWAQRGYDWYGGH